MENLTDGLGGNLAALRTKSGLKQKDLAARTTALGHPMTLSTVSKIEKGDRAMTVADVLAFSRALRVPPSLLLVPAWRDAEVTVMGESIESWRAVQWIAGRSTLTDNDPPFGTPVAVVTLRLQHDDLVAKLHDALADKFFFDNRGVLDGVVEGEGDRPPIDLQRRLRVLSRDLLDIRARMDLHDIPRPVLDEELAGHLGERSYQYRLTDTELASILVDRETSKPVDFSN